MESDRTRRLERLLDAALDRDPTEWQALLDSECGDDAELRREIVDLLGRVGSVDTFLEAPPAAAIAALLGDRRGAASELVGRRIGAYRVVREIGRGGMARVFLAERADGQFEQQVALKLLRPGLDSDIDHERIRAERRILASFQHPQIARLLDGGVTDEGQPYLVLEHVDGKPIDAFCDDGALTVRQRLELFVIVCEATQYAHRRLIVHRDLKPSNILVSAEGGVKLLDFGLAKLLEPSAGEAQTLTRQHWMTPEYAAPEQVLGQPVTTSTDVYQLGMVLYRLLAGRLPFDGRSVSLHLLEEAVLREEPEPPSSVLARSTAFDRARAVRGDLDAVVLKAIRKEPEERYASVDAFADDVRRHLSGHPVLARRQTAGYRALRFVRRYHVETLAAAGIALSLIGAAAFSISQANIARAQRDRAEAASQESQAITEFLLSLFTSSDPDAAGAESADVLTARELLRRGVERADGLEGAPDVQARMLEVTGRVYQNLGEYDGAQQLIERALALRSTGRGNEQQLASALVQLSNILLRQDRYAAADSIAQQALAVQERALGAAHPDVATTLHQIANIEVYRGDLVAAETHHRRALQVRQRALGAEDSLTAASHFLVGEILRRRGRVAQAETEFRRALELYERTQGPYHGNVARATLQLAYLFGDNPERAAEAGPLYLKALDVRRRFYGDRHAYVAHALADYSEYLTSRGEHAAAVSISRTQVEILREAYGPDHPGFFMANARLANSLYRAGQPQESKRLYQETIEAELRLHGADHSIVAGHERDLARVLMDGGDFEAADTLLQDALRITAQQWGLLHLKTAPTRALIGRLLTRQGQFEAADSVLRGAILSYESQVNVSHPELREMYGWLADLYHAWNRPAEAAQYRAIAAGAPGSTEL